jgi:hypothetical protein
MGPSGKCILGFHRTFRWLPSSAERGPNRLIGEVTNSEGASRMLTSHGRLLPPSDRIEQRLGPETLETLQNVGRPVEDVSSCDHLPHGLHTRPLLLARHVYCTCEGGCERIDVVRIDDHRVLEFLRGACQSAEHQYAALIVTGRDELLGHASAATSG